MLTAGDWVTLRAEHDLLLVLSTAPHPLDPSWPPAPVARRSRRRPRRSAADDPSRTFRAESARALEQAEVVFA